MEGPPEGGQGAGCRFFADFLWTSKESQAHHEIVCGAQPHVMRETLRSYSTLSNCHGRKRAGKENLETIY